MVKAQNEDGIIVASTTATQEELEKAFGAEVVKPDEKQEAAPAEVEAKPETEGDAAPEAQAEAAQTDEEAKPPKKSKKDFQRRVDTLTARNAELSRRYEEAVQRIEQMAQPKQAQAPDASGPQKIEPAQFQNYEEYLAALADARAEQKFRTLLEQNARQQAEAQQQAATQEVFDNYSRQVSTAKGKYEDFDDVVMRDDIVIPQSAQFAVMESPNGADVAYYLGKHPEVCDELGKLSDVGVMLKIGQISASLLPKPATQRASKAPAPVQPLTGNQARPTQVEPWEMDYQEYRRLRDSGQL